MIAEYHVGDWPPNDKTGTAFFVVMAPCGIRRRSYSLGMHKEAMKSFELAQERIEGVDLSVVSEKVAFWLALDALEKQGHWVGFAFGEHDK